MKQVLYDPTLPEFTIPPFVKTKLIVGLGSTQKLGAEVELFEAKKTLLVTDEGIVKAGLLDTVEKALDKEGIEFEIYDKVEPEPHIESFESVKGVVRKGKYDMVIGVGGGSSLDTAKTASIMATNPGEAKEYIGENLVRNPPLSQILIPTTAGTGSEITTCAVVTVGEFKNFICDNKMVPDIAIIDPLMSASMPQRLTASTGIDALAHAIEAFTSLASNPIIDALTLESIKMISSNLRIAYHQGGNLQARYKMAIAAAMAATASVCTLAHSVGQTFSSKYHVPHGLSVAIALPYAMEYNIPAAEGKSALVASAMGQDINGLTKREAAEKAVEALAHLLQDLDIPTSLKELDVPKEYIPKLVEDIVTGRSGQTRNLMVNPRLVTRNGLMKAIKRMWEGITK